MSRGKQLRVGLDARTMFMPRLRGTGRNLLDAYGLIPAMRPEWEFVLYHQRESEGITSASDSSGKSRTASALASLLSRPNVRARRIDIPGDRFDLWFQLRLPAAAWCDRTDLLHLPANAAPARCPVPFVATVHDLIPLVVPGEQRPRQQRSFRRRITRSIRGATHIISPSRATRDELIRIFGVDSGRITVIPWAPDRSIASAIGDTPRSVGTPPNSTLRAESERVRAHYGLDRTYLLNFSGSSPRKNAAGLIDAFARVAPASRPDVQLVLVGVEPAARRGELRARSERLGVRSACRFLGFVPQEDLPGLLGGARGMVMPSLSEGFGLPILDAYSCGTPVLTSNLSSMPEVAGEAALYCDPHNPDSIAAGIARLLDEATARRLTRAGFERLRMFSWERTAEAMCAVYERCLPRRSSRTTKPEAAVAETSKTCGARI